MAMRVIAQLVLGIPIDPAAVTPQGPGLDVEATHHAMAVLGYRFLRMATGEAPWMKYLPTRTARDYWAARQHLEELIAGTDSTAHTLSFAVGSLAIHPEVCTEARAVVDQAWNRHGGLTAESLGGLGYVRGVIKETLRLVSVASGSSSLEAVQETHLEEIGTVPAGTRILWSMQAAGRDPEAYPDPLRFLPQRWLHAERERSAPPMVDFGAGLHRCIGEHLAILEATVMLAQLLRHDDWELANGPSSLENQEQDLLIYPVDGMPVHFRSRSL
jgi:unspecific monooxygenase